MKSLHIYVTGLLAFMSCLTSCRNNYYVENDLHGVWQVISIENLSTDEIIEPQGTLYYLFQRTMVSLCYNYLDVPEKMTNVIAHFDVIALDSIGMGGFRVYTTGEGENINLEVNVSVGSLNKFGIYQDYTKFHVHQSRRTLTLTSDSARIMLCKY